MGGFTFVDSNGKIHFFTPNDLVEVIDKQLFPDGTKFVSQSTIISRCRGDFLSKALTVIQIMSFSSILVSRWVQGLPVSILEVTTLAYLACAATAYILWWPKPYNVQKSTLLLVPTCSQLDFCPAMDVCAALHWKNVPNTTFARSLYQEMECVPWYFRLFICITGPMTYGLLHLPAWNAPFPLEGERGLWKSAIVIVTVIGPALLYVQYFGVNVQESYDRAERGDVHVTPTKVLNAVICWVLLFLVIAYGLARLYILVESFRQLLYLPTDAFKVPNWSRYIPLFS